MNKIVFVLINILNYIFLLHYIFYSLYLNDILYCYHHCHRNSTSCDRDLEKWFIGFCPSCLCESLIILGHKSLSSFHKSMLLLSPALFHPHRPANSCGCHPEEHFIGFCPSCLYERLTILKHDGSSSIDTRPITSLTSPEANCQPFTTTLDGNHLPKSSSITFNPKLCSTKSFPALKNEGLSCALEPRRKSCDVIPYSPLFSISNPDDKHEIPIKEPKVETCNLTSSSIIELEADVEAEKTLKARDDLLDIDSQGKKSSSRDLKECIWFDTTNFRKKFRKWRQKQKMKKREWINTAGTLFIANKLSRVQFWET